MGIIITLLDFYYFYLSVRGGGSELWTNSNRTSSWLSDFPHTENLLLKMTGRPRPLLPPAGWQTFHLHLNLNFRPLILRRIINHIVCLNISITIARDFLYLLSKQRDSRECRSLWKYGNKEKKVLLSLLIYFGKYVPYSSQRKKTK